MAQAASEKGTKVSQRRRQEIIDVSARIFYEKGYEATSIQDVAEAVGILKGSLYYYIDSKEDLLFAVLEEAHQGGMAILDEVRAVDGDTLVKLRAFIELHMAFHARNLPKIAVFYHDFRSLSGERAKVILNQRRAYEAFVRDLVKAGQREGTICVDVDPKLATMGLLGMMNWIYHWYRPGGQWGPHDLAREFANMLIAGLACDPASHRPGHKSAVATLDPAGAGDGQRRSRTRRPKRS